MAAISKQMLQRKDELVAVLSQEVGKPPLEALLHELHICLEGLAYYARNAEQLLQDEAVHLGITLRSINSKIVFQPVGVVGIITPWNFPLSICFQSMVPALMAGNTVVIKPSEHSPLCTLKVREITDAARLPPGVVNVVPGDGTTGQYLVESDVDRIVFTGSVPTGRKIMQTAAQQLHPVVLELGGKDPAIVCSDADLELASNGIVWGGLLNAGQVCSSIERVYVMEDVVEDFSRRVADKVGKLTVGGGRAPGADVGPLIAPFQLERVRAHVEDARRKGAQVLIGGEPLKETGELFFAPTVLTNVDQEMLVMKEETFGPVLPIMAVAHEEEAIRLANDSAFGLTATVWTGDLKRGEQIARRLEAGTVWINTFGIEAPQMPWGGVKNSGIGLVSSRYGMLNFVNVKCITTDCSRKTAQDWWFPYSRQKWAFFDELFSKFHSTRIADKLKAAYRLLMGL